MSAADPLKPDTGWIRYLGILTAIGLIAIVFAPYALPKNPATLVGGIALLVVAIAGSQFLFHITTIISGSLEGRRRTQYQVAVSVAAPVAFTLILASHADAVPIRTLFDILSLWLLIPLGIIAWVCVLASTQLDREHPFRGFLIASAVLFAMCFMWSMGMTTDSDGEDSHWYLDPAKAKRARATGRYVWQYLLYVTVAYVALFLGRRRTRFWRKVV